MHRYRFSLPLLGTVVLALLLAGCGTKTTENTGGLPNIGLTGSVLGGALINADVLLVGIDINGQAQLNSEGEYQAPAGIETDADGAFAGQINGAYSGGLLVIVRANADTRLVCKQASGCGAAAYGDQLDVPDDFELWATVHSVTTGQHIEVNYLTHLAAKLAYTQFVSNGVGCNPADQASCAGITPTLGMLTPQSIYKAGTKLANLFELQSSPAYLMQWTPGRELSATTDTAREQAMAGLLNAAIAKHLLAGSDLSDDLNSFTDAFLNHVAQFYEAQNPATSEASIKSLLSDAVAEADALEAQSLGNSAVSSARTAFNSTLATLTDNQLTDVVGADYISDLGEQVTEARNFVTTVQSWVTSMADANLSDTQKFTPFFGASSAAQLENIGQSWTTFRQQVAPEMGAMFQPLAMFVDRALVCVTTSNCLADTSWYGKYTELSGASWDATEKSLAINTTNYKIKVQVGASSDNDQLYLAAFLGTTTVVSGNYQLVVSGGEINMYALLGLSAPLVQDEAPSYSSMTLTIPSAVIKLTTEALGTVDGSQRVVSTITNGSIAMVGTYDITQYDTLNPPAGEPDYHYNFSDVSIPVSVTVGNTTDAQDSISMSLTFSTSEAYTYYAKEKFPSLNLLLTDQALQNMVKFGGIDFQQQKISGLLMSNPDLVVGEVLTNKVGYALSSAYSSLPTKLKDILKLSSPANFEFASLTYPGAITSLVLYKKTGATNKTALQCINADGDWGCTSEVSLVDLGCTDNSFGEANGNASATAALEFLINNCGLTKVALPGRGYYEIQFPRASSSDPIDPLVSGDTYDVKLRSPYFYGLETFSLKVIPRMVENSTAEPVILANVIAAITSEEDVAISIGLASGYLGQSILDSIGISELVPIGERTLWFAYGADSTSGRDAVAYYIKDGTTTVAMKSFDKDQNLGDPVGFVRYGGALIGTVRKEGNVYVVRYLDNSWQLL
ncbi:MAG: hypothetical protein H7A09_04755 [Oceanospirillaceae bacterium]|nr:hypothetical protein [Oceanospirillaceae bacterium]MCP5349448.1 hypothetical protein [Oceanospirillaceae bacterium]